MTVTYLDCLRDALASLSVAATWQCPKGAALSLAAGRPHDFNAFEDNLAHTLPLSHTHTHTHSHTHTHTRIHRSWKHQPWLEARLPFAADARFRTFRLAGAALGSPSPPSRAPSTALLGRTQRTAMRWQRNQAGAPLLQTDLSPTAACSASTTGTPARTPGAPSTRTCQGGPH